MLEGLNPAQREAVEAVEGPLLIVAGPGSGKTRVITHRIGCLLGVCGISPYRILAVTFTNKAAREMKDRLERLVGAQASQLTVGTFHSFCARVLRRDGSHVGLDSNFTIYDDQDQLSLLKQAMVDAELDPRRFPPRAVQGIISRAKSVLKDPRTLALNPESYFEERAAHVYERYEELLGRNNAVDFDDLLMKAVHLFRSDPQVLGRYQQRFLHLMIDEFQDTNVAQYALAKLLAAEYRNVCAVGDPDQSIYSWRNADIRNILSFQQDFPEAKTINLEENYRSTSTILEAAKGIISANHMRLEKELRTQREAGPPIIVHEAHTEEEEAQYALSEVLRLKNEGFNPRDCAVMYRVNAQSRALEEACLRTGVPYQIVGGVRFYQRREVKELMCYLRLIANPHDSVSLGRVVNTPPRGIGQRSLEELERWAQSQGISLFTAIEAMAAGQPSGLSLSPRATAAIASFAHLIQQMAERSRQLDIVDLLDELLERTAYRQYLLERTDNGEERWENVMELREVAQEFRDMESPEGLHALLERFALVADVDGDDQSVEGTGLDERCAHAPAR